MEAANPFPALLEHEYLVEDVDEVVLRQVHPSLLHDGEPASRALHPTETDAGRMSVRRHALGPEEAHRSHTEDLGLRSAGTWGLAVQECLDVLTRVVDDSDAPDAPAAHAFVDFRSLTVMQTRAASKRLKAKAVERGPLYVAPADA